MNSCPAPERSRKTGNAKQIKTEIGMCEKTKSRDWMMVWTAITAIATVISASSIIFAVYSLYDGEKAIRANNLALQNNVQQSMTQITLSLDQLFIEHPELRQYFNDGVDPHRTRDYARASETAIMMLDVFDLSFAQVGTFKDQWTDPKGWTNWVADEFARSPFLREQYETNSSWYGTNMYELESHVNGLKNGTYRAVYQKRKGPKDE
jgi:hypothetical protein